MGYHARTRGLCARDDPRYEGLAWIAPPWDGTAEDNPELYELPAPRTLEELQREVRDRAKVRPDGMLAEGLSIGADLTCARSNGASIASYEGNLGSGKAYLENTATIRFEPTFPTGDKDDLARLFRQIVSIWQPDWALLDTLRTSREVQESLETYADYMIWLSEAEFGPAPVLQSASSEPFGDGTLLMANDWSVEGIRSLHQELLSAGILAASVNQPLNPQKVPQFPSEDP